ncbi:hypothetical protein AgCh_016688 [Apium graveolens]
MIYILPFAALSLAAVGGSQVKASIGALFVPAIYKTDSAGYTLINSTSIFFRLLLRDDAYQMGVYYNDLILKFSHLENKTSAVPIATYTLPGFYQKGNDHGSTIDRSDYVEAAGFSWEEASRNVSEVVLRVDLATAVRFKYAWWKSKRHTILAQSDVKFSVPLGHISAGFTPPIIPAVPTGVHTPVVQTRVPSVPPVVPAAPVMPTVPAAHAEKPEKFNGTNFKCWQQKMHFYLTTLHMDRFLKEEPPLLTAESNMQTVYAADAWKHSDYICRNYVLNCWSDSLYNVYSAKPTAKILWESLDHKYKTEDAGAKKWIVGRFLDYKMADSKTVVSQVQELQVIIHDIHAEGMVISESFQVAAVIEKLPHGWKDFNNYLKHKRKEMSMEDLIVRLHIEEDNRGSEKKVNVATEKANMVEHVTPPDPGSGIRVVTVFLSTISLHLINNNNLML